MKFKQFLQTCIHKIKSFFRKLREHPYSKKALSAWKTGKIQQSSRIGYDVIWNIVLFFLIIGVIGAFFAGGVGAGYFASLVKDEPIRDYENMEQNIYNYEETSSLYFANDKYIGDVRSDLYRQEVTLKNVSEDLKNAVIATEDEYFNEHNGIVPKAIVRALVQQATNAPMQSGGSTLTQQLVKNQILTNEVSFERKAKEILIAMRLERFFDKNEILEAYLNVVPYGRDASGGNIAGIQTAAQGIFGIDASEVNLAQAAYLAGLPQSPSYYTPFKNSGGLKGEEGIQPGLNRMKSVLERMHEAGYITKSQFENALSYDITTDFTDESPSPVEKYPYLTVMAQQRAKGIIQEHLAKEDGYTMEDLQNDDKLMEDYAIRADRALRQNGYDIHTTIDKKTHDTFQKIVQNYEHFGPDWTGYVTDEETGEKKKITQPIQTGGILIENKTGRIIGFVGGRNFNKDSQFNFAFQSKRSNGSTMKPILTYAPAFEQGVIQPGTPIADVRKTYSTPSGGYTPHNYGGGYHGIVPARKALYNSYNIPAIKIYDKIRGKDPVSEFLEPMGITSIRDNEYTHLSLGIGGTTDGVSVEENVNAFATFANQGKFVDAHLIEQITDKEGNVIFEYNPDPVDVFSPQTAYLTVDVMRDVIDRGTATYLQSQLKYNHVDWAGKTGTSQNYKDAWFVGVNPNVSMGVWIGYRKGKNIRCPSCSLSYSQRNEKLWAQLVNAASDINPELMAPEQKFERPGGIVTRSYCAISGKLPSDLCKEAGLIKTDIFNAKYVPTEKDDSLIRGSYVIVDGKAVLAAENTPKEFVEGDGITFNPEFLKRKGYDQLNDPSTLFPSTNRKAWEKIGLPQSDVSNKVVENDGKKPSAPGAVKASGSKLTWNQSSSSDVVGYRIYQAKRPNSSFRLIGNTTGTKFTFTDKKAVYRVKAVDYFGLESAASKEVLVGDFSKSENEKSGHSNNAAEGNQQNENTNKNSGSEKQ
ncbi:penicillin-binding protein [Lentibacillus cibarius]|uniref:Penicillin-binding protein n=1 Tax=Lentibacillus cibarius TaxID=2583219 RepID=A0A549YM69_9BACI|nr:transglycosylase domain-containing protein [Lentibacillus cibarius]TRM12970.1 penicillin-binding protein [Lentibacillus cibarius]